MKTKIVVEQLEVYSDKKKYKVIALSNRTRPEIGATLTEEDVKKLISESENTTVDVKPSKKKR